MEILRDPWEGSAKCKVTSKDKKQRFIKLTSRGRTKSTRKWKSHPKCKHKPKTMMMDDVQWTLIHLFRVDCPEDTVLPMHWMLKAELKQLSCKRKEVKPQCAAMCLCRAARRRQALKFYKSHRCLQLPAWVSILNINLHTLRFLRSHIGFSHLDILRQSRL